MKPVSGLLAEMICAQMRGPYAWVIDVDMRGEFGDPDEGVTGMVGPARPTYELVEEIRNVRHGEMFRMRTGARVTVAGRMIVHPEYCDTVDWDAPYWDFGRPAGCTSIDYWNANTARWEQR